MPFIDRDEAGRRLADRVSDLALVRPTVLALPRGGVPVGARVAEALDAPLDVIVVRKLGVPFQPELAMGAIGEDAVRVVDDDIVAACGVSEAELRRVEAREWAEVDRRARYYRSGRPRASLPGRTAVVVDDGMATGSTVRAACLVARAHGATGVVVAVPVSSREAAARIRDVADDLVVVETPEPFLAVGQWYLRFGQIPDAEVVRILDRAWQRERAEGPAVAVSSRGPAPSDDPPDDPADEPPAYDELGVDRETAVEVDGVRLFGRLRVPPHARGLVVFAHGSGSGRHSPRNRYVADVLHHAGLATFLFDLLTPEEERARANVFNVELLGSRLRRITDWLAARPGLERLPIGYFGASTGAAAALWAAAQPGITVAAVVSRGGRPDLAGPALADVIAPTLLVVGGRDEEVLELNRYARSVMTADVEIVVVPKATHLFGEPGALECVAALAEHWFHEHLPAPAVAGDPGPG